MKDFDQDRGEPLNEDERTFRLRGQVFTLKPRVRPEVLIPASLVTTASSIGEDVANIDEMLKAFLNGDDAARYEELRAREDDPIEYRELLAIVRWAVEVSTGRPTEQPAPSGSGAGESGTGSTAASSLRAVEA